ncbi:MAG: DUF1223 domain-containing protein [Acidobacteriota bacterium]|nr:DUF1223 domain-containing protein [Acidobacteriota bacterium]
MKQIFAVAFLMILSGFFACSFQSRASVADVQQTKTSEPAENLLLATSKQPVLVELFTSEGCSSCPPADRVLMQLEREQPSATAEIITLSLHVDYWDSAVWRDPFSSLSYSKRQDIYSEHFSGENYTPQMIVDGQQAFVGSDSNKAQKAITDAAKMPKAKIELAETQNKLKIKITDVPAHENATVFLAIAEDNLASSVRGGENSGSKLEHTSVVRQLKSLGVLTAEQKNLDIESAFELEPEWKKEDLKFIVFLQENVSRRIFGARKILLAN